MVDLFHLTECRWPGVTSKKPCNRHKTIVRSTFQTREGNIIPLSNQTRRPIKSIRSESTDSDSNVVVVKARPQWKRPNASPYTVESGLPPLEPLSKNYHPTAFPGKEDINSRLPPLPSGHLVSRSLTGSTKQLSNISEERSNEPSDLDKLPVSLSCPTSGRLKGKVWVN
uniref:Uncharacterized protein n=1 Tax=Ditylenchus dipsaci TaxID=166011 RepID=A0A915D241_9BILA